MLEIETFVPSFVKELLGDEGARREMIECLNKRLPYAKQDFAAIAVGLSENGGMRGADTWILRSNGSSFYIQDSYSADYVLPTPDASQDIQLLTSPQPGAARTVYSFKRALRTCDAENDWEILPGVSHHMVWAIGTGAALTQHTPTNRGDAIVTLREEPAAVAALLKPVPDDPADLQKFEIRMPAVPVPANRTTSYLCRHFEAPKVDQKYHVIRYEGKPQSMLVHHIVIFSCIKPPAATDANGYFDCSSMDINCPEFYMSWSPGVDTFRTPAEAGFPVGGGDGNRYFAMQVHYNNPERLENQVDSSGVDWYYTPTLRPNDIGILVLGSIEVFIPGSSPLPTVLLPNHCPSTCTSRLSTNLTFIANGFHMHTLGDAMTTQKIRGGREIQPLGVRRHYDFNYQAYAEIRDPEVATVVPGDALITTCKYRSTEGVRNASTVFGESTRNEMCFNFAAYYPKSPAVQYCIGFSSSTLLPPFAVCAKRDSPVLAGLSDADDGNLIGLYGELTRRGEIVQAPVPRFERLAAGTCDPSWRRGELPRTTSAGVTATAGAATTRAAETGTGTAASRVAAAGRVEVGAAAVVAVVAGVMAVL
ncbi:hypothetical protein HDU96_008964 [Phlyctochytrium bullatum]|nr:hypothetical protein HDU96_008964 [Phlyctochytrium bullatum]